MSQDFLFVLAAGFAVSVLCSLVAGAGYHRRLYTTLGRRGALPRGWWWSPSQYHDRLTPTERRAVLSWFYVGAASFVLVVGTAIAVLGVALR